MGKGGGEHERGAPVHPKRSEPRPLSAGPPGRPIVTDGLITDPLGVTAVLFALVAIADLAARWGVLRRAGTAILVIALGALAANTRLIPPAASGGPVYDPVFAVVIPAAIFLVLLEVNLAALRRAGGAMLGAFGLGAIGTAVGVLAAHWLTGAGPALGSSAGPVAGMFTGTYIGGSANFNTVALGFGVARRARSTPPPRWSTT